LQKVVLEKWKGGIESMEERAIETTYSQSHNPKSQLSLYVRGATAAALGEKFNENEFQLHLGLVFRSFRDEFKRKKKKGLSALLQERRRLSRRQTVCFIYIYFFSFLFFF
jgi:hypothetical protein